MTAQKKRDVSQLLAETTSGELKQVADGIYVLPGFGNCTIVFAESAALLEAEAVENASTG